MEVGLGLGVGLCVGLDDGWVEESGAESGEDVACWVFCRLLFLSVPMAVATGLGSWVFRFALHSSCWDRGVLRFVDFGASGCCVLQKFRDVDRCATRDVDA